MLQVITCIVTTHPEFLIPLDLQSPQIHDLRLFPDLTIKPKTVSPIIQGSYPVKCEHTKVHAGTFTHASYTKYFYRGAQAYHEMLELCTAHYPFLLCSFLYESVMLSLWQLKWGPTYKYRYKERTLATIIIRVLLPDTDKQKITRCFANVYN